MGIFLWIGREPIPFFVAPPGSSYMPSVNRWASVTDNDGSACKGLEGKKEFLYPRKIVLKKPG